MNFLTQTALCTALQTHETEFPNIGLNLEFSRGFSLFGIPIYWYGILIALAFLIGFVYMTKRAEGFGLNEDRVFDVGIVALVTAFLGARLYYVVFNNLNPDRDTTYNFITFFTTIRSGGLALYGGVIGGVIGGAIMAKIRKVRILPLLDLGFIPLLLGQAIGRWGNFFNQEAYGAATAGNLPWGMTGSIIRANGDVGIGELVHPTFLYESLWCLAGFLIFHFYSKKFKTFDGEIALLVTAWYGLGRGWIEGLRTDSLWLGDFRISQVVAITSACLAIITFVVFKIIVAKSKTYVLYAKTDESKQIIVEYKAKLEETKNKKKKDEKKAPSILGDDETNSEDGESSVDGDETVSDEETKEPAEEAQEPAEEKKPEPVPPKLHSDPLPADFEDFKETDNLVKHISEADDTTEDENGENS